MSEKPAYDTLLTMADFESPIKADEDGRIEYADPRFGAIVVSIAALITRVENTEAECRRLRSALGAKSFGQPMDLGHTFYPPGDAIPSRGGVNEHLIGVVYTHLVGNLLVVTRFQKNDTGSKLKPGQTIDVGVVDTRLAHDVEPNDYFYVEL